MLVWKDDLAGVDWQELSELYRLAPLGDKPPRELELVFGNSVFRLFVYDAGRLVATGRVLADGRDCAYLCDIAILPSHQGQCLGKEMVGRLLRLSSGHKKIILYSVPDKEAFYQGFGFRRMLTAMAIFEDPAAATTKGYLAPA
ncbi:MAG: GNAT family N-acetyltransferase [Bradyrhizobium sp.]|uniref:GNAT family N-acetyltransferase n=1 Tax=Bradyrhizobium sp. TaxID=376 RepID=UPI003C7E0B91